MPEASVLLAFVVASLLLALAPGQDNLYVLGLSATQGFRSGFVVTLGLCSGLLIHTTLVATGLAVFISQSAWLILVLKLLGILYLLYLALTLWRSQSTLEASRVDARQTIRLYRKGLLLNLSNPKVSLFFLLFLPQFTVDTGGPLGWQLFGLGLLFLLCALAVFSSIAWFGGQLSSWLVNQPKSIIHLNRLCSLCLFVVAIHMTFSIWEVTL